MNEVNGKNIIDHFITFLNCWPVTVLSWSVVAYAFIYTYLYNFSLFIFTVKIFVAGIIVVFFVVFGIPILYILYQITKVLLMFMYELVRWKFGEI
jgi:hypothetical protein